MDYRRYIYKAKKALLFLGLCFALFWGSALPAAALTESDIDSEAAILMDADTGAILFSKNIERRMYPASTTKIMTAMLTLEYSAPGEVVTVSGDAVLLPAGSSIAGLYAGEQLSVSQALYALMLPSANDAANALAEHVSGTQADFAELMNRRALSIGAKSTHFTSAHGLYNAEHYTTAYDMALITRAAIKSRPFMEYFGAVSYTLPATNLAPQRQLLGYQHMLSPDSAHYDSRVIGGKVGYTQESGHTMSTLAEYNGRRLICVVMNTSSRQKFDDTRALLDYGFDKNPAAIRFLGDNAISVRPYGSLSPMDPDWAPDTPALLSGTVGDKALPATFKAFILIYTKSSGVYRYALTGLLLLMSGAMALLFYAISSLIGLRKRKTKALPRGVTGHNRGVI